VFGERRSTYAQLHDRVRRLANALSALGVGSGDRVAVLLHNCETCFEVLFATAMLGVIYVPLNFRLIAREIGQVLESCAPKLLIAGESFADIVGSLESMPTFPPHLRWVNDQPTEPQKTDEASYNHWLALFNPDAAPLPVAAETPQMLLHSSGTTGAPKGVVFTHATTLASSMAKIIDFGLTPDDTTVIFGPLFHAAPLMDLALPLLLRGGRVVIGASRQFDPQRLLQTVAQERGTVIPIIPTMLRRLLAEPVDSTLDLSSLRLIITGGEPCPIPVIHRVHERFPEVGFVNNYGSTEGGPITTFLAPELSRAKPGSVGKEAFGVEVRIVDAQGRRLGPGLVGELEVRSPVMCRGYWNLSDTTGAQLRDGWWHTGDLAWRDDEGFLWISGRSKDVIRSGAENIYPAEVEQVIAALEGVIEVGVIGVPDERWGETVVAFVVADAAAGLDAERVVEHCRGHLASYKKPHDVVFVDSLPRGTTSKVDKNALRQIWSARDA
jgi:fatty-acyl-CoA synthase